LGQGLLARLAEAEALPVSGAFR